MSIYTSFYQVRPPRNTAVKTGELAQQQMSKIRYQRAIENLLGQSDKDYFKLTHAQKAETTVKQTQMSLAEGFKNFFERGTMF